MFEEHFGAFVGQSRIVLNLLNLPKKEGMM